MKDLTDNELDLTLQLEETRMALLKMTERAATAEIEATRLMQKETMGRGRALMAEQERRAAEKQKASAADPKPTA